MIYHLISVVSGTTAGLSTTDLIGILTIIVMVFGMLLTAIGVLVLKLFNDLNNRITELKTDSTASINAVWSELESIRSRLWRDGPAGQSPS